MKKFTFYKLSNGVRVVEVPMQGVKSVALGVFSTVGSRYESAEDNGISHFLEHLVFKGTKKYPTTADTSSLEALGAIQNAWTDVDATSYWCKIPSDQFHRGIDLVSDLALNPLVPPKDLEIEKGVILEEMNRRNDQPDQLVWEEFQAQMFADHPLGRSILGLPKVIKSATRDQILKYHTKHYTSDSLIVVVAGDLPGDTKATIKKLFGHLPKKAWVGPEGFKTKALKKMHFVKRPKDNQVNLVLGGYAATVYDTDRYIQNILLTVLGSGMSSRLFSELREKRGLCYSVSASDEKYPDVGVWTVYAGVATDKLKSALIGIKEQLQNLVDKPISEAELKSAKQRLKGMIIFSQEDPRRQMEYYASQVIDRDQEIYDYDQNLAKLMGVTAKQVQDYAAKIFRADNHYLTVLGPVTEKMLK